MPFNIGLEIARGANGILYKGDNNLGLTVAIKIIGASCGDPDFIVKQAEALGRVESPHVVKVIVVDDFDDPANRGTTRPGIVMEWLEGKTFREIIADGSLSRDDARRIGIGMIDGLHAIHQSGLAHNDLHHDNIMVGASFVKILDIQYLNTLQDDSSAAQESKLKRDRTSMAGLLNQVLAKAHIDSQKISAFNNALASDDSLGAARTSFDAALSAEPIDVEKETERLLHLLTESAFVETQEYATLLADSTPDPVIRPLLERIMEKRIADIPRRKFIRAIWSRLGSDDRVSIVQKLATQIDAEVPGGQFRPPMNLLAAFGESGWTNLPALTRVRLEKAMIDDMRKGQNNAYQGLQEGALGLWCVVFYPYFADKKAILKNATYLLRVRWGGQNYIGQYFMDILDDLPDTDEERETLTKEIVEALDDEAFRVKQNLHLLPEAWRQEIEGRAKP